MDFKNVHHLREILVTDTHGNSNSTMQYSSQSIARFRPSFVEVPFHDQQTARELYARLGGKRRPGLRIGMEILVEITTIAEDAAQEESI